MTVIPERAESARKGNRSRRRAPFTKGDFVALAVGALLVSSMISWFAVRVAQNVINDRAVAAGRQGSPVPSH